MSVQIIEILLYDSLKVFLCSTERQTKGHTLYSVNLGYEDKKLFMLNSNEHKYVLVINFKMPTIVGILKFMTRINNNFFVLRKNCLICVYLILMKISNFMLM